MQIGFVNFSQEELARKNKVLQMVRDQTAIDELGFGRIRDAFANMMFPGMSTLQRRAKYFAVMPSLYYQATKKSYNSVRDVRTQIVKWEIRLTDMLVNGAGNDENKKTGITGRSMLTAAKSDPSKFVKYDPTYIYMNGLRTFDMIKGDINIYHLIFDRSKQANQQKPKYKASEEGEMSDSEDKSGLLQFIAPCEEIYDFDNGTILPLELTKKEAEYIKGHIVNSIKSMDSMLNCSASRRSNDGVPPSGNGRSARATKTYNEKQCFQPSSFPAFQPSSFLGEKETCAIDHYSLLYCFASPPRCPHRNSLKRKQSRRILSKTALLKTAKARRPNIGAPSTALPRVGKKTAAIQADASFWTQPS